LPCHFNIGIALNVARQGPTGPLTRKQWVILFLSGITGCYAASFLNFLGLVYITARLERILLFADLTFVLILNALNSGRPISRLQVVALGPTYTGIVIAFTGNIDATVQKDIMPGAFRVVLSRLVYAIYLVGSDRMIARLGAQRFTSYAVMAATVPAVLHCAFRNGLDLLQYPMPVYVPSLSMSAFATVIPTLMIAEGIRRIGSGDTSTVGSVGPIFIIALSVTILNELISREHIMGTLPFLAGIFLVNWRGKYQNNFVSTKR